MASARRPAVLVSLLILTFVVTSCSSTPAPSRTPAGATAPAPSGSAKKPGEIPEILQWSAPRLGGGRIRGEDYAGQDLAMWFWAPW